MNVQGRNEPLRPGRVQAVVVDLVAAEFEFQGGRGEETPPATATPS